MSQAEERRKGRQERRRQALTLLEHDLGVTLGEGAVGDVPAA
jgi:hypothetical protein